MKLLPWLDKPDFTNIIGEIPDNFPFEQKLAPVVKLLVAGWLTDLIGAAKVAELKEAFEGGYAEQPVAITEENQAWADLIRPFLVLATWSQYILNGNVSITKTGPVTKKTELSDPIDQSQRASLSADYYKQAKGWAVRISRKVQDSQTACTKSQAGSGRSSVSVIGKKNNSYFLDQH